MADKSDLESRLMHVPLFGQLSRRQVKKLVSKAKVTSHSAGQDITEQDKGSLAFHLVLSGSADVKVNGKKVRALGAGEYFGEISMIDGRRRSATVTATSPLSTLAVPHLAFQDLLDDEPEVARQILVRLCDRLREAEAAE